MKKEKTKFESVSKIITIVFFVLIVYIAFSNLELVRFSNLKKVVNEKYKESSFYEEGFGKEKENNFQNQNQNQNVEVKNNNANQQNNELLNQNFNQDFSNPNDINNGVGNNLNANNLNEDFSKTDNLNQTGQNEGEEKVCLVKKSQCNTCVRQGKNDNFVCTKVFCENEVFVCEQFLKETP
ncbi:hypothetical protein CSB11_02905 [Candidatus Campbellbacteria bacterium]|nr:MAG: hypothetical protein CSB11_02905 [Candidatus Campbellbacteria bacterium]